MLNRIAQGAVRELHGLGIDDLTADEIVNLHVLGERQERAGKRRDVVMASGAVVVGNVTLWPLTCAALDWLDCALVWFKEAPESRTWALPFAMAHGRVHGFLSSLVSAKAASMAIAQWVPTITATFDEIAEGCSMAMDAKADTERAEARSCFLAAVGWARCRNPAIASAMLAASGDVFDDAKKSDEDKGEAVAEFNRWRVDCAELVALGGGTIEEWYHEDRRIVVHAYRAARRAASDSHESGDPSNAAALTQAIREFRAVVAEIVETRKARKAAANG